MPECVFNFVFEVRRLGFTSERVGKILKLYSFVGRNEHAFTGKLIWNLGDFVGLLLTDELKSLDIGILRKRFCKSRRAGISLGRGAS